MIFSKNAALCIMAECSCAKCRYYPVSLLLGVTNKPFMLNAFMLSVVMLRVITLRVVMLGVDIY